MNNPLLRHYDARRSQYGIAQHVARSPYLNNLHNFPTGTNRHRIHDFMQSRISHTVIANGS